VSRLTAQQDALEARVLQDLADGKPHAPSARTAYRGPGRGPDPKALALLAGLADDDETEPKTAAYIRGFGGRPTLGEDRATGESPSWHVRASAALDAAARDRARAEGRPLGALVRQAVAEYLGRAA
jgi:hypothetical protein